MGKLLGWAFVVVVGLFVWSSIGGSPPTEADMRRRDQSRTIVNTIATAATAASQNTPMRLKEGSAIGCGDPAVLDRLRVMASQRDSEAWAGLARAAIDAGQCRFIDHADEFFVSETSTLDQRYRVRLKGQQSTLWLRGVDELVPAE